MHNRHRSLANEIRSYLSEFGITIPVGISPLRQAIPVLLEQNHSQPTTRFLVLPAEMEEELRQIDDRIDLHDKRIEQSAKEDDRIKRLLKIECIGPIVASEFVASVGDAQQFKGGRDMAAWLGLVPKQYSSGGKERLGSISKRGNSHLRTLLIHGACSAFKASVSKQDKAETADLEQVR